jgi:hypothetical protein
VQKPGARNCQLRCFYVKYLCSIYEISSRLRSNNILASLGINGDSILHHLSVTLVWNVRRICPADVPTLQNNLSFVVSKEIKQMPTKYKRNRIFSLAHLSDGLFYSSSTSPQYFNIVNVPSSKNPSANSIQKTKSDKKTVLAENRYVNKPLSAYNFMYCVYRNLQNSI